MSQTDKQTIGKKGEDLAALFLKKQGYEILDRNYWKKWGEIDIIAKKDGIIHFIEVKTVSRKGVLEEKGDVYLPEDNIHPWKRKRLARTVETYLLEKQIGEDRDWQVDAMAIYLNREGKVLKVDQLEDIIL